jgi:Mlc titration factor MtfA (ptsG expression regulator)
LVVTDRVRLTIAAEASLLALYLPEGCFGPLKAVLVYPTAFVPQRFAWVRENAPLAPHAALGESWERGTVVLAWDDVLRGVEMPHDGQNVVLHEFAHQLDSAGGKANGVPSLGSSHRYAAWTEMLERNFARFTREMRNGRPSVLDPYAATNEAEFFAVATEVFFERPQALRHQYPELFGELQRYFRQDPSLRSAPAHSIDRNGPAAP